VAGDAPSGGWAVGIAESSAEARDIHQVVAITSGGLATSSTTVRAWSAGGVQLHHIVDPTTGTSAAPYWTLVSATGASCVDANAASTAAIVWGRRAVAELGTRCQPARLVRHDGRVATVNGWPAAEQVAA
jgi:thiamine biosynthesis lipoprotein